jgi:hypothetical protein
MREDGAVQYDGWEFNWRFRQRGWRSHVGHLSAGGFVRRRRWVRLMMRPAASQPRPVPDASAPPSAINTPVLPPDDRTDDIWQGKLDADWARYQVLMRNIGSDGHRLDLWRRWLQPTGDTAAAVFAPLRSKQWTEDSDYMPSELQDEEVRSRAKPSPLTNRDAVAAVVRAHVSTRMSGARARSDFHCRAKIYCAHSRSRHREMSFSAFSLERASWQTLHPPRLASTWMQKSRTSPIFGVTVKIWRKETSPLPPRLCSDLESNGRLHDLPLLSLTVSCLLITLLFPSPGCGPWNTPYACCFVLIPATRMYRIPRVHYKHLFDVV